MTLKLSVRNAKYPEYQKWEDVIFLEMQQKYIDYVAETLLSDADEWRIHTGLSTNMLSYYCYMQLSEMKKIIKRRKWYFAGIYGEYLSGNLPLFIGLFKEQNILSIPKDQ